VRQTRLEGEGEQKRGVDRRNAKNSPHESWEGHTEETARCKRSQGRIHRQTINQEFTYEWGNSGGKGQERKPQSKGRKLNAQRKRKTSLQGGVKKIIGRGG